MRACVTHFRLAQPLVVRAAAARRAPTYCMMHHSAACCINCVVLLASQQCLWHTLCSNFCKQQGVVLAGLLGGVRLVVGSPNALYPQVKPGKLQTLCMVPVFAWSWAWFWHKLAPLYSVLVLAMNSGVSSRPVWVVYT